MPDYWKSTRLSSPQETFKVLADLRGRLWLCRGQSKCYPKLLPSIDRGTLYGLSRVDKLTLERQSLDLFRANVRFFSDPGEQAALTNDILGLVVLRHNQVPTRLLDWSQSPYIAAYFASSGHDEEDGEIWCFDEPLYEKMGTEQWSRFPETTTDGSGNPQNLDPRFPTAFCVDEPSDWFVCHFYPRGFHRQNAQAGAYSFTPRFNRDHADAIAGLLKNDSHFHRYIISSDLKHVLRDRLKEKHGIWRGSLFPDVAGASETARLVFPSE